jgi:hypothetical protein
MLATEDVVREVMTDDGGALAAMASGESGAER